MQKVTNEKTLTQIFQEEQHKRYDAALKTTAFSSSQITRSWRRSMPKALLNISPVQLQVKADEFKILVGAAKGRSMLSMFAFGAINNGIESCSAKQLGLNLEDYEDLMNTVAELSEQWVYQSNPIRAQATAEAQDIAERESQKRNEKAEEESKNLKSDAARKGMKVVENAAGKDVVVPDTAKN